MKVNIILVNEVGEELVADTITEQEVQILGEHLDALVEIRIAELEMEYPEARCIYREDVKSYYEQRAEQYQAIFEEELAWALEHEDEIDEDPEEYADEMARSYFEYN